MRQGSEEVEAKLQGLVIAAWS